MNDLYHKYLVTIVHQVAFTNLAILNYLSQKSSNHRSLTFAFESFLVIFIVQSQFLVANPAFSHIQHANRAHGADEGMKGLSDNDVDFTQKNRDFWATHLVIWGRKMGTWPVEMEIWGSPKIYMVPQNCL